MIIGDIHGQFYDLLHILEKAGKLHKTNFVFLGDYVDRGIHSIECLLLLYVLKMKHHKSISLLRGNHESRSMSEHFTFRKDCLDQYDSAVYEKFHESFDCLPLCCIVNK